MYRTTLSLPEETHTRLRRVAAQRGVSMAAIIREAIDEKLDRLAPKPASLGVARSDVTGTARRTADERPRAALVALILGTGPRCASLDGSDADYSAFRALIESASEGSSFLHRLSSRVDYWIHRRLNPGVIVALLGDIEAGAYEVADLGPSDFERVSVLCDRYADADVGFVDAAVLAVVERLGEPKLATLDRRHFGLLRPRHVQSLGLLP